MAFWLIGLAAVATAGVVGTGAASMIEGKKQTEATLKQQKEFSLMSAYVDYGQALTSAPGAIPI